MCWWLVGGIVTLVVTAPSQTKYIVAFSTSLVTTNSNQQGI